MKREQIMERIEKQICYTKEKVSKTTPVPFSLECSFCIREDHIHLFDDYKKITGVIAGHLFFPLTNSTQLIFFPLSSIINDEVDLEIWMKNVDDIFGDMLKFYLEKEIKTIHSLSKHAEESLSASEN